MRTGSTGIRTWMLHSALFLGLYTLQLMHLLKTAKASLQTARLRLLQ